MKPDSPGELRRVAAGWIIALDEADSASQPRVLSECEAWQSQHPEHRKIFQQMRQMWQAVSDQEKPKRKKYISAGLLAVALCLGILALPPWPYLSADYRTQVGQIQQIELPDGSVAILNTNSAIDIDYTNDHRTISLLRGEVFVSVHKDSSQRDFMVSTKHVKAIARGTRYSVALNKQHSTVNVTTSRVQVKPANSRLDAIELRAGQSLTVSNNKTGQIINHLPAQPDWASNQLVFNDAPLKTVAGHLSQYRHGKIFLGKGLKQADLRFTGVLPANDSDSAIEILASSLNLTVKSWTPYVIQLQATNR